MKFEAPANANYAAVVVAHTKFVELSGCDNVKASLIFNNQIIVAKDAQVNEKGLFFPLETALSPEFLRENNLYRKFEYGNKDDLSTGFFEQQGRVKAVKFRGHKSEGFFIPLSSLSYTGVDLTSLQIGDTFDKIGEHEICKKYVPKFNEAKVKGAQVKGRQPKLEDSIVDGQFRFHFDTENLRRNVHKIEPDDYISITDKWHGCLQENTKILLPDFTSVSIGSIVKDNLVGLQVLGADEDGNLIPTTITNVFDNGTTEEWLRVQGTRSGCGPGASTFQVLATPNHRFFTDGGYVAASQLNVGDTVYTMRYSPTLTSLQKSVLLGKMLGDGTLTIGNQTAQLDFTHKATHREYLDWSVASLGSIAGQRVVEEKTSGYGSAMNRTGTLRLPCVYDYLHTFVSSGEKHVPEWVADDLDPIAVAFWYMDDGNLKHTELQEDRAEFATNGFTDADCRILIRGLNRLGVEARIHSNAGYRILLDADAAEKLFLLIAPYIPEVMQYKLPERYRGHIGWMPRDKAKEYKPLLVAQTITAVAPVELREGLSNKKFDIETGTHNFFANGVLVHNSSVVLANLLVKRKLTFFDRLATLLGIKVQETEYGTTYSSRRVIKAVNGESKGTADHFYSEDIWGVVAKEVQGQIPPGFTLYGEIVGYTTTGEPIQNGYPYGCKPGEHKLLIYRVTFTNVAGLVIELDYLMMIEFCKKYGFETLPLFFFGTAQEFVDHHGEYSQEYETFGGALLAALESTFADDQDCEYNPKGTPAEGVVVRVDKLNECVNFKLKSYRFLQAETKALDKGQIDLETSESVVEEEEVTA